MSNNAIKRVGAALILLAKAHGSPAASAQGTGARANWKRAYSAGLRVHGDAAAQRSVGPETRTNDPFKHLPRLEPSLLKVERAKSSRDKQDKSTLVFGKTFTDHMLHCDWDQERGWHAPRISPHEDLRISPAASSLHYALQCFEGMKAYRDVDGNIRLFRPDLNMKRLNNSLARLRFPTVDPDALIELISKLVIEDADWIPEGDGFSLYVRPTAVSTHPYLGVCCSENVKLFVILSPVGPYYEEGFKPISLYADPVNRRAWPGGMGFAKAGGNYAPTILPQVHAQEEHKCAQVLWLFGDEHYVTEVGSMNIFFLIEKEGDGGLELITSPLDSGDILDGVTRRSVLELSREWGTLEGGVELDVSERRLTMGEILKASKEGRLREVFGTGTAAVIAPVKSIKYGDEDIKVPSGADIGPVARRLWDTITDIQYGRVQHPWSVKIA